VVALTGLTRGVLGGEPLRDDQLDRIHADAMTVLTDVGVEVHHDGALELLRSHGQRVDGTRVHLDPAFVLEQVGKAPSRFTLHSRNPARAVTIGGGSRACTHSGGSPFVSDLERGRREGTLADHLEIIRLAQAADGLSIVQCGGTEAQELPETSRHLDMEYHCLRWSDKPYVSYGTSGPKARDGIELAALAFGGRQAIAERPVLLGVVNPNSPLVWDELMVDALLAWAEARQPVLVTPFLLAGATAPVSVAGGLALLVAEALSGVTLIQLVSPGAPAVFGSFFSAIDMRSGGPAFGTPEFVLGTLAGGQLARRYGLPFRGGGGLCTSNAVDAQAASETAMALWATFLSGADMVMHAAGWLEGGLVTSFEKLALDLELLRMFDWLEAGIEVDDEHVALDAIREVGPGGMFLAAGHTLEHFREWSFMSPMFRAQAYPTWQKLGSPRADETAVHVWQALRDRYVDPGLDPGTDEALQAFIARRKLELDD
jgi:trimethylamine--corrinoid protein Co-methyltransferase